jgi:hypothetical protein
MSYNRLTKGTAIVGDLIIDGGGAVTSSPIKAVQAGTASLDPGSISTVSRGSVTFTLTGAASGDAIVMMPPSALNDDLIFCGADVTSANTVTVYLYNPTAGSIDDTARTWKYVWLDLT